MRGTGHGQWMAALVVLALAVTGLGSVAVPDAAASTCDAGISTEAGLVAAATCYASEGAGSVTTVTLAGDVTLTATLELNNSTTAQFVIDGNGNTLTTVTENDFNDVDGIYLPAGHLVLTDIVFEAKSREGIQMAADTAVEMIDTVIEGAEVSTAIAAGFSGTSVTLQNSTIRDTQLDAISTDGVLSMVDSTIDGPRGGIRGFENSDITITNSTLIDNFDEFSQTGVVFDGTGSLTGVTIVDYGNGIAGTGSVTMSGTLIARANNGSCRTIDGLTVTDGGGNVLAVACGPVAATTNANTGVGTLAANPCDPSVTSCTDTVALDISSPAIDAWGDCAPLGDDQRGVSRTAGKCDAGAHEAFDCPPGAVGTEAELNFLIRCYNDAGAGETISATLTADIPLAAALRQLDNDTDATLTIDGVGYQLTPPSGQAGFDILDGDLTLEDLTIAGGFNGVIVRGDGHLTLTESTVSGASADAVLGFGAGNTAALTMARSTLDGNQYGVRGLGGPVSIDSSTISNSTFDGVVTGPGGTTIVNSTLSNNLVGLEIVGGINTVTSTSIVHSSSTGFTATDSSTGMTTFVDSMSVNNNGGCNGTSGGLGAVVFDGGGNVHNGGPSADNGCGPILPTAGASHTSLPTLTQNACETGVTCTMTVALPEGFPAKGAGETCDPTVDQRGVARPSVDCDAGAYEAANESPVGVDDDFGSLVGEDDPATALDVLANDSDLESETLTVTSVTNLTAGAGQVVIDGDGLGVTYTPALNWNGDTSFTYEITDGEGATDTALVEVFVSPENDSPTTMPDTLTTFEDNPDYAQVDVALNDDDVDGDSLTVTSVSFAPGDEAKGGLAIFPPTTVGYRPAAGFVGTATVYYVISDGPDSTAGQIAVTVSPENDPPVAGDDTGDDGFTIDEDDPPTSLDVLANDTDADDDVLSVASATQPSPGQGVVTVTGGGELFFTPAPNFFGTAVFTYTVTDGNGAFDMADVSVEVLSINDPPDAVDDEVEVPENYGPFPISVRNNDSDVEGSVTIVSATQPPAGEGTVFPGTGSITYVTAADFTGVTTFEYTIEDADGAQDTAMVTVTVVEVNDDPVANPDFPIVVEDSTQNVIDVLANDTDGDSTTLTVTAVTQPDDGTVVIGPGGATVRYTPDAGFRSANNSDRDEFTYTVSDGEGGTDVGTVSVFVQSSNTSPVGNDDTFVVTTIPVMELDVLDNDTDADNDTLTIVSVTQPFPIRAGYVRIASDEKSIDFFSNEAFGGEATFFYTLSDGQSGSSAKVTVTFGSGLSCDPNYVPCVPVSGTDLNCSDIGTTVRVIDGDPHGLDSDLNGLGCGSDAPPYLFCNNLLVTIDLAVAPSGTGTFGDDVIMGTPGDDSIVGRDGNDSICAGGGDDIVDAGDGNDVVIGGDGDDRIVGGPGADVLRGNTGADTIDGGSGNDRVLGGIGDDILLGGSGDDYLGGFGGDDEINGGSGDEIIFGGFGADTISGEDGDDVIRGLIGNDTIFGGPGNDTLDGDRGSDRISGGPGADIVRGGNAGDVLRGDGGNDSVSGGRADDQLSGGFGTDVCVGNDQFVADTTDGSCESVFGVP